MATDGAGPDGSELSEWLGLVEKLRSPWHHGDCKLAADAIERMSAELAEWRKLRDPANLHVNLLRGLPAQLTREQAMHLCADDLQRMVELEAVARHEADCAEAFKAEAEALRAAPWIGECQACGHQHEAPRPQPLTEEQRIRLFIELNSPCVQASSPSAMFTIIVRAVERAHGIGPNVAANRPRSGPG